MTQSTTSIITIHLMVKIDVYSYIFCLPLLFLSKRTFRIFNKNFGEKGLCALHFSSLRHTNVRIQLVYVLPCQTEADLGGPGVRPPPFWDKIWLLI